MQRVVLLVDMNAFFISCEAMRHPGLDAVPAAVAGDPRRRSGIILTANYPARTFGVRTTMTLGEARRLCPEILLLAPDHAFYSSTSRRVMELMGRYTPVIEQNSVDEAWLDLTGCEGVCGSPLNAAKSIMSSLQKELSLPCSIGISENKFLSKMASEMKKPLGITELWRKDIREKLWPLPVEAMYGIGSRTAARLRALGLYTVGDAALYGREVLPKSLGKYGGLIYSLANGVDDDPVSPRREDAMKSIGRSVTLPQDLKDLDFARKVVLSLAEEVGADARRHGKKGTTVHLTIKYSDFTTVTRQTPVPATFLTRDIALAGETLLKKNWSSRPVRLLGLSLSGFEGEEPVQLTFFEDPKAAGVAREEHLEKAVDDLRRRFGRGTIRRASLLDDDCPHGHDV